MQTFSVTLRCTPNPHDHFGRKLNSVCIPYATEGRQCGFLLMSVSNHASHSSSAKRARTEGTPSFQLNKEVGTCLAYSCGGKILRKSLHVAGCDKHKTGKCRFRYIYLRGSSDCACCRGKIPSYTPCLGIIRPSGAGSNLLQKTQARVYFPCCWLQCSCLRFVPPQELGENVLLTNVILTVGSHASHVVRLRSETLRVCSLR